MRSMRAKTGVAIAELIMEMMACHDLPKSFLVGQCYDNAASMSGAYKGTRAVTKTHYPYADYYASSSHTLNLTLNDCAGSCIPASIFFGHLNRLFNLFSSSPKGSLPMPCMGGSGSS